ncbi:DNA repair protein RecN [Aquisphaera giovannonii]|uniref:DNA repair protein RecN n=1 Tax=Aquisphaera giovannonii TaxID=406548 RepID=A0A5B9W1V2_9BACT|nr:DNA repair protein RecN [Aquisphaera giovannonii]
MQNLALIEDVQVELDRGFCAWTGETGAGKSLLLNALGLVLGGKASAELVRAGKSEARAAAVFEVEQPALRAEIEAILGGPLDDEGLIITRRISSQGRSSSQVNGMPVTIGTLQRLGEQLVDIHGQNEGRALLDPDRQRSLLDGYGCLGEPLSVYRKARAEHDELRRRRQELLDASQAREREKALLEFERDELASADPREGEYDELVQESHRLANAEALRTAAADGYDALYEADRSAQVILKRVARGLEPLARSVPELAEAAGTLERLADEVREVAYCLRDLGQGWDDDPARLEDVETRLATYRRLSTRFHCKPDELAARREETEAKLAAIERDDHDLEGLDGPLAAAFRRMKDAAEALTAARQRTARDFGKAIQARLKPLGLERARLSVEVEPRELGDDPTAPSPPEHGADRVEIMFLANPGEVPRPLRKVASGGELSRLTLAAKSVLACSDRVSTLVLDEVDTGVGGRLGAALGRTLAELATHHQVVCVTHLPQVASYARRQWVIRKQVERGRTRTTITPLDEALRVEELAAMMRGASADDGTRQEAMAMLQEARERLGEDEAPPASPVAAAALAGSNGRAGARRR